MKIRALGLSRRAMDYTEKTRLERDLLARESNEKERFRERVRVEHQVVAGRIKLEVVRGHTANILQHTATHYNTLQHTVTHCNTLQHTATHYNTLQHTITHCNTL